MNAECSPSSYRAGSFISLADSYLLKGKVTMLFITHQIPRGLQVDEVLSFGARQQMVKMEQVEDER